MKSFLIMLAMVVGVEAAQYAEQFNSWTPAQKAAVHQWAIEYHGFNPNKSVIDARNAFNFKAIATTTYTTNTLPRTDTITVLLSQKLKAVATAYGINAGMTEAQKNQKFIDAYTAISGNTAGSIVQRDQVVMDRSDFWLAYFTLQTLTPDDSETYDVVTVSHTYAPSIRETMGLPADVTCDDLEEAYRYQP